MTMPTVLAALGPKIGVFVASLALGGGVAFVGSGAIAPKAPVSTAGQRPAFVGTDTGNTPVGPSAAPNLAAFDLTAASGAAAPLVNLPGLSDTDMGVAAGALLDPPPASWLNPSGFPRITPVTQFDGGPFQGANCTLASGAMLARLGFGIVTTGSMLRTLQNDQVGGTGLDDLATALWRGYGVTMKYGLLRPEQLKNLLGAGYGAVIQGDYAQIPEPLKLQRGFSGGHAIYLDGYYDKGPTPAYYVIDPIGRPNRYEGEWWPASIVDSFAEALGGGTLIRAAWVFPPGGTPPEVVGPDIVQLPPSGGEQPAPGESPGPSAQPAPSASTGPGTAPPPEPGDQQPSKPVDQPGINGTATSGGLDLNPSLAFCALEPQPPGCPPGIPGIFQTPPNQTNIRAGPNLELKFVDSDRPNAALVGFTVDPGANSDVVFWEADGSPPDVHHASAILALDLSGQTITVARLDVLASTQYHFQVIAGNDVGGSQSPVGTFTTADGVVRFDVSVSAASNPVYKLDVGFAPYLHLALNSYAEPLVRVDRLASPCLSTILFGALAFCGDTQVAPPAAVVCQRAAVSYEVLGSNASAVLVRAFPATPGVNPTSGVVLSTVLETQGPPGSGDVSVGCLASGVSYNVVLDGVGDDRGILASRFVTAP